MKEKQWHITNEAQMLDLAAELASKLERPAVLCLQGNLGAGKTVFARGFLRALAYDGDVTSPTFSLINTYELDEGPVFHMDLYRLEGDEEARSTGIEDALNDYEAFCLIEWSERLTYLLPNEYYILKIEHIVGEENSRAISLKTVGMEA